MKKTNLVSGFAILMIFAVGWLFGDNIVAVSGTGTHTINTDIYVDVATSTEMNMANVNKVLVFATFTSESIINLSVKRDMTYRLHDNSSTELVSNEIVRNLQKDRTGDKGVGSLVYIFDVSGITSGTRTFSLAHKVTGTKETQTTASIVAIALNTDSVPYPLLDHDLKSIIAFVETSSSVFSAVTGLVTGTVSLATAGDLLVIASINSQSSGSAATGEWTLQMKKGTGEFTDIGTPISRTLSGTADQGIITLIALIEDETVDDYYFQVAHRAVTGRVQTLNTSLVAVSLGYLKGGTEVRKFECDVTSPSTDPTTTLTTTSPAATLSTIQAKGNNVLLLTQFGMQATGPAISNYTLTSNVGSVSSTTMQRRMSNDTDQGSGGIVGLVSGLIPSAEYDFDFNHFLSETGVTLTTKDITFAAIQLTDTYVDVVLPVTLSSFEANYTNSKPHINWTTQTESNNAYWNVYRSISQNMGQAIHLNENEIIEGAGTTTEPTDYTYVDMHGIVENFTYYYWIESVDNAGETELYGPVSLLIPNGGTNDGTPTTPDSYGLQQNYPNPFNPSTSISFALQEDSNVELIIYNIKGERLRTIFNDQVYADEINTVIWDGRNTNGREVSSGLYLYKLITENKVYNMKMLIVK